MHLSRQENCRTLRCTWSIAYRRCSNYIFILNLTSGFKGFGKDNRKTLQESFKCWDSVPLILETWRYIPLPYISECTKVEALEAATLHPAELLNITAQKGTLAYNSDADFILLDDDLNLLQTYVDGELAYQVENPSKPRPIITHREK